MNSGTGNRRPVSMVARWLVVAWAGGLSGAGAEAAQPAAPGTAAAVPAPPPSPEPTVVQAASPAAGRGSAFAVQGGWWSVEAEWRARVGVYAAAGVPWVMVPLAVMGDATWVVPVAGRIGYDFALSPRWSLRASGHAAMMIANEKSKCGCADEDPSRRTFVFAEIGIRYQSPSGFVAGADLPLVGLRTPHHGFPPPLSLAFSQVYIGHSWGR
jgi:hypothetical protein